ncbi:protein Aim2p [[Candida] jaroonii]|uniref:Protein Aim2p n=1 Tax=[Candida] jaroonii TaxID=467808 RepID=A0ACA9YBD9_9ASCO|nr:protein Aim2p [[Candida] jaroonii]
MASNPPGACCLEKSLHEGTPIGSYKTVAGLDTYVVGTENGNDNIIVIATDIYGYKLQNVLLIADQIAKVGKYQVLIPDILKGDPIEEEFATWLPKHGPEITTPIFDGFLSSLKSEYKPKFLGGIGYCFGAKYVIQNLRKDGLLDAGAGAHPSFVSVEEVEDVAKPLTISAAQIDPIFTVELRHKTEEILSKKEGVSWELTLFAGVSHGFAVRGDISIPQVKYAKEKALTDQLAFFAANK